MIVITCENRSHDHVYCIWSLNELRHYRGDYLTLERYHTMSCWLYRKESEVNSPKINHSGLKIRAAVWNFLAPSKIRINGFRYSNLNILKRLTKPCRSDGIWLSKPLHRNSSVLRQLNSFVVKWKSWEKRRGVYLSKHLEFQLEAYWWSPIPVKLLY